MAVAEAGMFRAPTWSVPGETDKKQARCLRTDDLE